MLEPIVAGRTSAIRLSKKVHADGAEFFRAACELVLEGIIAKRRDKPYRSGRRPEWLKIKCARHQTFGLSKRSWGISYGGIVVGQAKRRDMEPLPHDGKLLCGAMNSIDP